MMMRRLDRCSLSAPHQTHFGLRLLVLLLLWSPSFSVPGKNDEPLQSIEVGGFLSDKDFNDCYDALNASDTNGDGEVNATEYVTFAKLMSPEGLLSGVDAFSQLPLQFQAAFFAAACLCEDETFGGSNDPNCCKGDNAHIRVPSMPPEDMDLQDRLYMYAVCSYTNSAIEAVETPAPTQSPAASEPPAAPGPPTVPNQQPTSAPAPTPIITLPATVECQIAVTNGKTDLTPAVVASYLDDLTQAMDLLAPQVVEESLGSGRRVLLRQQQQQRRLSVSVVDPSEARVLSNVTCPSGTPDSSLCQNIEATVQLRFRDEADPLEQVETFQTALSAAIADGRLETSLSEVNPQSRAAVLAPAGETTTGLSGGAIAGICVAALVVVALAGYGYHRSQHPAKTDEQKAAVEPIETEDKKVSPAVGSVGPDHERDGAGDVSIASDEVYTLPEPIVATTAAAAASGKLLGASEPDYGGRASRKAVEAMEAGEDIVAEPELDIHPDSSSNAGSSGWSSSAGISSLNTGSVDDSMDQAAALGATLAAIGATSALTQKGANDQTRSALDKPGTEGEPSRSQLDALIEAGDWAAVGATAALLAAASDSQSEQSKSELSGNVQREGGGRSLDALRAAELDNLVDAGDWEGVVLAAAKFEAAESSAGSRSSIDNESIDTGTPGTGSAATPSVETSVSESASKVQRRAELRAEVEALVRRVVPEEIDNVDEMMNQFKGREEELVETLRTMQERSVAQKARAAGQKAAKTEARRSVQRGVVPGIDPSTASSADEPTERRTALEAAIEAGDWDAVGQAAAMMGDTSVASASTGEIDRLADNMSAASSSAAGSGLRRRLQLEGVDEDRARELDSMIDRGDWSGVVEATKKFKEADAKKKPGRSEEEEEALREAEAWMKIAEESRAAAGTAADAGASDAAEWAIQRSLDQLKKKEEELQKGKKSEGDDEEEV